MRESVCVCEREVERGDDRERERERGVSGPGEQRAIEEEVALPQRLRALQSERQLLVQGYLADNPPPP